MMKKTRITLILAMLFMLLLSGCGAVKFEINSSSKKASIKISDVEDGTYAEISTMTVSGGKTVHIDSSLNKGKLKIEFAEAILVSSADEVDEYVAGNIVETVEVGPGENLEVTIDPGRYVVQLTTVGQTEGTVEININ
ncbi:MAG: hypothetical protein J5365_06340 [Erysipelotrichaceae bacterium]|nr:hypothetical protein [Erysipelotrichaceae bacterium]